MEKLQLNETPKTPAVNFDDSLGLIELKGRSIPEDPNLFYDPLISWVSNYCNQPSNKTTVNLNLEYFNTSSSKRILELLKNLEPLKIAKHEIIINWFYESDDDNMLEAGETYESMLKIPFNKIETDR
jgi:hypothetical protein